MKKYRIYVEETITYTNCIEANSKEEAEELAYKNLEEDSVDTWDISPTNAPAPEIIEVEEIKWQKNLLTKMMLLKLKNY